MGAEDLELWRRNPVDCVKELLGNPTLAQELRFAPEHAYEDEEANVHVFDEMNSGDWWWDAQVQDHITLTCQNNHRQD
jgi:hypothetical protein